jgi:hypothetical protein
MMLTFLGDPAPATPVLELREALREDEAPYLNRLIQAQAPVKVCKLQVEPARQSGSACIFNSGNDPKKTWACASRASPPKYPTAIRRPTSGSKVESSYHVPGELPPNEGRGQLQLRLHGERVETFEAFSDRFDLLP